jgi:hypothetical protein
LIRAGKHHTKAPPHLSITTLSQVSAGVLSRRSRFWLGCIRDVQVIIHLMVISRSKILIRSTTAQQVIPVSFFHYLTFLSDVAPYHHLRPLLCFIINFLGHYLWSEGFSANVVFKYSPTFKLPLLWYDVYQHSKTSLHHLET